MKRRAGTIDRLSASAQIAVLLAKICPRGAELTIVVPHDPELPRTERDLFEKRLRFGSPAPFITAST